MNSKFLTPLKEGCRDRVFPACLPGEPNAILRRAVPLTRKRVAQGFIKSGRAGFTLIELLVVIVIVTILAGLLIPIRSAALAAAAKTQCSQNLRELGKGFLLYTVDHHQELPPIRDANSDIWLDLIVPYLEHEGGKLSWKDNTPAAYCPSFVEASGETQVYVSKGCATSYTANVGVLTDTSASSAPCKRLPSIENVSRVLLVFDGIPYPNGRDRVNNISLLLPKDQGGYGGYYHGGKANFLFVDGHVESLTPQQSQTVIYSVQGGKLY